MARLLHRLGLASATHSRLVVSLWAFLLIAAVLAGTFAGGTYTTNMSIPGTPAQTLADRLAKDLPVAARGAGTITFTSDKPLTDDQKSGISAALVEVGKVDGVHDVTDPFKITEQTNAQIAQMEGAPAQIAAAEEQLATSEKQLSDGQAQLDQQKATVEASAAQIEQSRAQLEQARNQLPEEFRNVPSSELPAPLAGQVAQIEAGEAQLAEGEAQLQAGQEQLAQAQAQIDEGRKKLEEGKTTLAEQKAQLDQGKAMLELAGDYSVVSADGTTAIGMVSFDEPDMSIADSTKNGVKEAVTDALPAGVTAYYSQTIDTDISSLFGPSEAVGLAVAALTLLIMLRSVFASVLPIITGLVGVGITVMSSMVLARTVEMHQVSPILGIMLGLAVGIDYTLFVVNRHREQLKAGHRLDDSIALAIGTSGNAVVFAGMTVMIALLALNLVGIPFLGVLGNVAAVAVLLAVLASITLTPAMLHIIGYKVLSKKSREKARTTTTIVKPHENHTGKRDPLPTRHPWLTTLVTVALLGTLAIPFFSMRLGLPDGATEQPGTPAHEGYVLMSEKFGPGRNGPLIAVADLPSGLDEAAKARYTTEIGREIKSVDRVDSVVPIGTSEDGQTVAFQVISAEGPSDIKTEQLVQDLRAGSPYSIDSLDVPVEVTGLSAMQIDISDKLAGALPIYLGVVILISLVLLVLVFRSILVPLIATAGFLASVIAAMGAVVAVYQWGHLGWFFQTENPGPILSFLPTLMIGILFGLAMDYQLFLATGMRESWAHGRPAKRAVVDGLYAGRRVVVAAAIIMFSVFAGFIFAHLSMVRPIGFGLAIGVLLDAFVVRMALMPALITIVGEKAWWLPAWLEKILPSVDVEGASLLEEAQDESGIGKHSAPADSEDELTEESDEVHETADLDEVDEATDLDEVETYTPGRHSKRD